MRLMKNMKWSFATPAGSADGGNNVSQFEVLEQIEELGVGLFWATDAEGRLVYLSPQALASLGSYLVAKTPASSQERSRLAC